MAFDLADASTVLSIAAALMALWVMQCVTHNAGFASSHKVSMLGLRVSLAALAGGLLFGAYRVAIGAAAVDGADVVIKLTLLSFLCTLPFAVGGRLGADWLSRR